jgi:hypothetical protein
MTEPLGEKPELRMKELFAKVAVERCKNRKG